MKETGARIGIATDGDADRFGIVDEDGTFIQPNYVIAVLFDYLVETPGLEEWRRQVSFHHQHDQRSGGASQSRRCMKRQSVSNTLAS